MYTETLDQFTPSQEVSNKKIFGISSNIVYRINLIFAKLGTFISGNLQINEF